MNDRVSLGDYMAAVDTTDQWSQRKMVVFTILDRHVVGRLGRDAT